MSSVMDRVGALGKLVLKGGAVARGKESESKAATAKQPWEGGQLTPWTFALVAPNASAYTGGAGTNTWFVVNPHQTDEKKVGVVVDPGPYNHEHTKAIIREGYRTCRKSSWFPRSAA